MFRKTKPLEQASSTQVDDFYAIMLSAHEGLSDEQSQRLIARLVLLLANEVGSLQLLDVLFKQARQDI